MQAKEKRRNKIQETWGGRRNAERNQNKRDEKEKKKRKKKNRSKQMRHMKLKW